MSTSTNKALVRTFVDALFSRGDLQAIDHMLAPAFVNHDPMPGFGTDREALRQSAVIFRAAFPDWRSELESLVAEGDLVVERFTARGTHTGEIFGVAPTGREIRLRGVNIFRIANGVITDRWGRLDELGFLHQLGLIPQPANSVSDR